MILAATRPLYTGGTIFPTEYDNLYRRINNSLKQLICLAFRQEEARTNTTCFPDAATIITYEIVAALSRRHLPSKLNDDQVNRLRTVSACIPTEVSLSLGQLLHESSINGITQHRLPDSVDAMSYFFRERILNYEERMISAVRNRLNTLEGADKYPVAVQRFIDKVRQRGQVCLHYRIHSYGYSKESWLHNMKSCVRGMIGFKRSVFVSLLNDLESVLAQIFSV
jgi:hypothetical protein